MATSMSSFWMGLATPCRRASHTVAATCFPDSRPELVSIGPGDSAAFGIEWVHVPSGGETTCATAAALAVTPPHEYASLMIPAIVSACGGGHVRVTAIQFHSVTDQASQASAAFSMYIRL